MSPFTEQLPVRHPLLDSIRIFGPGDRGVYDEVVRRDTPRLDRDLRSWGPRGLRRGGPEGRGNSRPFWTAPSNTRVPVKGTVDGSDPDGSDQGRDGEGPKRPCPLSPVLERLVNDTGTGKVGQGGSVVPFTRSPLSYTKGRFSKQSIPLNV